ncbi:MAG: hypothetical protein NVS3B25_07440 [Hymenobacter sp.]
MPVASFGSVFDAAQVRLAQLGQAWLDAYAAARPTDRFEAALLDLRFGLETVAQLAPGPDQDTVVGYLIETYGLLAVGTDPFLRPLLPPIPASGATVRYLAYAINGKLLRDNGKAVAAGALLTP